MRIAFEYEPEGFVLPSGELYLPDFYLPQIKKFAEVKPIAFTRAERGRCEGLAVGLGREVLLLSGVPDFRPYEGVTGCRGDDWPTVCEYSLDVETYRPYYLDENRLFSCPGDEDCAEDAVSQCYRDAVYAARGARFDGVE
jgi:hypothetical protein